MTHGTESSRDTRHFGIRNPQDFFGGLALVALALVALWATRELPGQQGFAFGPGTAPRMFAVLLGVVGAGIMVHGLLVLGPPLERWAIRGPLFVTLSVLVFAACIRPLGLVISTFLLVVVSAAGSKEVRWIETVIWGALLTAFCAILFPYGLNLPMQLWPRF